jgi:hypothetical protein
MYTASSFRAQHQSPALLISVPRLTNAFLSSGRITPIPDFWRSRICIGTMEHLPGGRQSGSRHLHTTAKHLAKPPRFPFWNTFTLLNRTTLNSSCEQIGLLLTWRVAVHRLRAALASLCVCPRLRHARRRDDSCGGSVPPRRRGLQAL